MADTALARETPPVANTKVRHVRIDDGLWNEVKRIATSRRETVAAVIKRALVEYVERHGGKVER